jgi:hypothetical protein
MRWRMAEASRGVGTWGRVSRMIREEPQVLRRFRDDDRRERAGRRRATFEGEALLGRLVGLERSRRSRSRRCSGPARSRPPTGAASSASTTSPSVSSRARFSTLPTPSEADAQRELVRIAARATGIAAERDLRDYFRLDLADARARVGELVEAGELVPVTVAGLKGPRYLAKDAKIPRRVDARALLSPFDSLVWNRDRTRELFGFDYRLEIYVPQHKRVHGYYVLPFLYGDALVARVDLKNDRQARVLRAHATHIESGARKRDVQPALREELHAMAGWLGAREVGV